jgi:dTMP kinase
LTLIFDLPPELGLQRAAERHNQNPASASGGLDRFETMNQAFHRSLRDEFLAIAKAQPQRCKVIDATRSVKAVADDVWSIVRRQFSL